MQAQSEYTLTWQTTPSASVLLAGFIGKAVAPKALGKPYAKESS